MIVQIIWTYPVMDIQVQLLNDLKNRAPSAKQLVEESIPRGRNLWRKQDDEIRQAINRRHTR